MGDKAVKEISSAGGKMIIPDALKLFFRRLGCAEMNELFAFMFIEIAVYLILIFQRRSAPEMRWT